MNAKAITIAIGSGKGGVGKTTTATNLAIHYARKGLRVGLVDLDPLSDIATLLDLQESEDVLTQATGSGEQSLDHYILPVFAKLDLIFPASKVEGARRSELLERLITQHMADLAQRYELLIFDLPAGVRQEDNLALMPLIANLVVVTNAEPTAHVSAGEYINSILSLNTQVKIGLWHNKYAPADDASFDARDVIGNYNRNVPAEARIDPKLALDRTDDIAFIPKDSALDLLQGNPSLLTHVERGMRDMLDLIQEQRLADLLQEWPIPRRTCDLIRNYLARNKELQNTEDCLDHLDSYVALLLESSRSGVSRDEGDNGARGIFDPAQKATLRPMLDAVKRDRFGAAVVSVMELLEKAIEEQEAARRPFSHKTQTRIDKDIDRKVSSLLMYINRNYSGAGSFIRGSAGVLLFYFALYKLLQSKTVVKLITDFIPKRKSSHGRQVRDKHAQIRNLVENNREYSQRYFALIKTLLPVVFKQIQAIAETFELNHLVFRKDDAGRRVNRAAYLKLLTNFVHDTVNGGLSVIVGFPYRPASVAFCRSADELLQGAAAPASA